VSFSEAEHYRIKRLEDQVKLLSDRLGIPFDDGSAGMPPEIVQLVRDGKKIEAIKAYSQLTGAGLADSKNAIDALPY
jgi:ribosomal protein L7/L12